MNERIRELANQMLFHGATFLVSDVELEKFAELIVKECIGICERVGTYDHTSPADCIGVMKKEFGVE